MNTECNSGNSSSIPLSLVSLPVRLQPTIIIECNACHSNIYHGICLAFPPIYTYGCLENSLLSVHFWGRHWTISRTQLSIYASIRPTFGYRMRILIECTVQASMALMAPLPASIYVNRVGRIRDINLVSRCPRTEQSFTMPVLAFWKSLAVANLQWNTVSYTWKYTRFIQYMWLSCLVGLRLLRFATSPLWNCCASMVILQLWELTMPQYNN